MDGSQAQKADLSAMDKLGQLAAHIVIELTNDRPVFDGNRHWTFDDIQEAVDKDPDVARLSRLLILADTDVQRARAAQMYQIVFARTAKMIADDLAMGFYLQHKSRRPPAINSTH